MGYKILSIGILLLNAHSSSAPAHWAESRAQLPTHKMVAGLSDEQTDEFMLGRSFFTVHWVEAPSATTARDGLGHLFNANACVACHREIRHKQTFDANGNNSRTLVFKLAQPKLHRYGDHSPTPDDPVYGRQIAVNGISDVPFEAKTDVIWQEKTVQLADKTTVTLRKPLPQLSQHQYGALHPDTTISLRMAPVLVGVGLLEQIPESSILAGQDLHDGDHNGIFGKANLVPSPENNQISVGRFGYKASLPNLLMQTADASAYDMGLTNPFFPDEQCTTSQHACLNAPRSRPSPEGQLDLPLSRLSAIAFYLSKLRSPENLPSNHQQRAKTLFHQLQCATCHTPNQTTSNGTHFQPFTNLLLHDMGEELADARPEYQASPRHWRTAPLWGLGAKTRAQIPLLHDGRARNITEAILWHGGEAQASQHAFTQLSTEQRHILLKYLESL